MDIVYTILSYCQQPRLITYLIYQVNMSYSSFKEYEEYMFNKGWLSTVPFGDRNADFITPKGAEVLEILRMAIETLA